MFDHPDLDQLRYEVKISTFFLVTVPAITYYVVKFKLGHLFEPNEGLVAGLSCILSIWLVIVCIIIIKYKSDCKS